MTDTAPVVLIVDDDKFLLDMYSLKFVQAGYIVHPCFSTQEALAILRSGITAAVVLFDITMPGEDGFSLLKTIHDEKLSPNARLIALTNQSNDEDRKHAQDLGVDQYVIKATMIPSEVVNMVKEELTKR